MIESIIVAIVAAIIIGVVAYSYSKRIADLKDVHNKQIAELKEAHEKQIAELKEAQTAQLEQLKAAQTAQLEQVKESQQKQIEALREMNREQVESQMKLIREQMQTTSEEILKRRQDELGERNKEQVSKIIDPLTQSLKSMREAFDKSKEQQNEALTRLDATIKVNMEKSAALGETADRLTRALTGEVKVQGNFGELKLKQLLEDLELKEGEQFDTQETLRDKAGKQAKGDDGRGLIPDFILHFPNNRHVVVDSKMSLTDYERYMNAEDGTPEKSEYLKAHVASVRAQVKRLARKEYTKYLPEGYNRLNFAIMYVPIEGALNLALLNATTLWREAYDEGVMILGPQTMYMNLRVLEMMWTQVRQLKNQQAMIDAANIVVERVQDFGMRFIDVETSMNSTVEKMAKLKVSTAESGRSIITAAKSLLKAGAKENKKKKSLDEMDSTVFIESNE
ncbi:MAG: DNA recombination protein RmuC [Prevotella stercorea]|nr:DNA recombination protein RmuC [Leyella stercorea]MDY2708763.1 DNA recombination protein RmuC [Prevotella sp.]MEE0488815.1 DNA recombination protein RmuC [Prevotella sp.]